RAATTGPMGRCRAAGSPSKITGASARAANGGRNRITVPARPQSTAAPPATGCGVMCRVLPSDSIPVPSARSAAIIRSVSRERNAPRTVVGSSASAASGRARLVRDLDPGTVIVAASGAGRGGRPHGLSGGVCAAPRLDARGLALRLALALVLLLDQVHAVGPLLGELVEFGTMRAPVVQPPRGRGLTAPVRDGEHRPCGDGAPGEELLELL